MSFCIPGSTLNPVAGSMSMSSKGTSVTLPVVLSSRNGADDDVPSIQGRRAALSNPKSNPVAVFPWFGQRDVSVIDDGNGSFWPAWKFQLKRKLMDGGIVSDWVRNGSIKLGKQSTSMAHCNVVLGSNLVIWCWLDPSSCSVAIVLKHFKGLVFKGLVSQFRPNNQEPEIEWQHRQMQLDNNPFNRLKL